MNDKFKYLLDKLTPYVICTRDNYAKLKSADLVVKHFDSLEAKNSDFFTRVLNLDAKCFDNSGMGMPKWVFFDCAIIPGVVFGFGIETQKLSANDKKFLDITEDCFYPLSMYAALGDMEQNWFGHNLSSLNTKLEEELSGLGFLTKKMAMDFIPAKNFRGATQWDSPALYLHLKFGPVKLLSSFTPIHSHPMTLCYEYYKGETGKGERLELNSDLIHELQENIDQGREVVLIKKEKNCIWITRD